MFQSLVQQKGDGAASGNRIKHLLLTKSVRKDPGHTEEEILRD